MNKNINEDIMNKTIHYVLEDENKIDDQINNVKKFDFVNWISSIDSKVRNDSRESSFSSVESANESDIQITSNSNDKYINLDDYKNKS